MQPGGSYLRDDQVFAGISRPSASCSSETMVRIDRGRARRRTANEPRGPELQIVIAQFPEISGPLSNRKPCSRWTEPFLVVQKLLATYLMSVLETCKRAGRSGLEFVSQTLRAFANPLLPHPILLTPPLITHIP